MNHFKTGSYFNNCNWGLNAETCFIRNIRVNLQNKIDNNRLSIQMKQENLNNKGNAQAPYASPKVKVVAINVQGVLCQSVGEYEDPFGTKEDI